MADLNVKLGELMKEKGLVVTQKGKIKVAEDGAFCKFLERRGIKVPAEPKLPQPERRGKTTLRTVVMHLPVLPRGHAKVYR